MIVTSITMQRTLSLIILFGLMATAQGSQQSQPRPPAGEQAVLKPEYISPHLLEWLIDVNEEIDLKQIWRLLKIEDASDVPSKCNGDCSAETFEIKVDGEEQGKTVALKIAFESGDFYQYLIFKKAGSGSGKEAWRFIGNIDSSLQRYGPPQHRIENGDDRAWFVIRELWGRGPGLIAYGEVWYEIKDTEVREVLSYPVQGHNIPCLRSLGRSYKSLLLRHGLENGVYTVPIQLLISYNISECKRGDDSTALFAKAQKAVYVWNKEKGRFILDQARSDVTASEIESVYNLEDSTSEQFIEYNFKELSEIARSGDAGQKNWLRKFLINVKDGPLKTTLQQSLQIPVEPIKRD
jgi:hypothetical protein